MQNTELTVIIPVYNAEKYLKQCLDSILSQTFKNFEVICVNDRSSDSSLKILNEYSSKDSRIKVVNNLKNLGPGASRNIAIKQAAGEFIHFIDADDFLVGNNVYSVLMEQCINEDIDLLIFNHKEFDDVTSTFIEDESLKRFRFFYENKYLAHLWTQKELEKHYFNIQIMPCFKIHRKRILIENEIYFPEDIFYEDTAFSNYVSLYFKKIKVIKDQLYAYRINVNTSTTSNIMDKFKDIVTIHRVMFNFLVERNLYEKYKHRFVSLCIESLCWYFLPQIDDYDKAVELNMQIAAFIKDLKLSKKDLKELEYPSLKTVINNYMSYTGTDELLNLNLVVAGIPFLSVKQGIKETKIYLFKKILLYKITNTNERRAVHYLFGFLPYLKMKIKFAKIYYLFLLIPIFKIDICNFYYRDNFNFTLRQKQLLVSGRKENCCMEVKCEK